MTEEVAREILAALRELNRTLSQPTKVTSASARASDWFVPFNDVATLTGTTDLNVWDPTASRRFICRGGWVTAVVHTILATGGAGGTVYFADSGTGKPVAPIGGFAATAAVGTVISAGVPFDLKEGVQGSVLGAKVRIETSVTIGSGVIAVAGVLWGTEVTT